MMPVRLQRKRTKGYRLPPGAVYVGRPTKWGNPFKVGQPNLFGTITADNRHAALLYAAFARQNERLVAEARAELRGRDLACWCSPNEQCHGDTLIELANE